MPISLRSLTGGRTLATACSACGVLGALLRLDYALGHHHLRHRASSDALEYLERAQLWLRPGASAELSATIWPPGTSALWAVLSALDPSQGAAAVANALGSLLVMPLTAAMAGLLAGARAAWIALALSALHPGFIHYAGFALAEQAFQLVAALALYLSLSALVRLERDPPISRTQGWIIGAAVGCSWGLATLFRTNALPVLALGGLWLGLRHAGQLPRAAALVGAGAALALVLLLGAAAQRCTETAGGRFCLVSNNLAMNMALGQAGQVYGLEFNDPSRPEETTGWVPPALLHHGYQGMGRVPASIYDQPAVLRWLAGRFAENPLLFGVRALGNALDLFGLDYWPNEFGRWPERLLTVWTQLFFALTFVPAAFALWLLLRTGPRRPVATFVAGGLAGLLLTAAASLGEARYRLPFDGLWIALASAVYAGARDFPVMGFAGVTALGARRWYAWAAALALGACAIVGVSHPALRLGAHLPQRAAALIGRVEHSPASRYAHARESASTWDAPGNYVWQCQPSCPELRLGWPSARTAGRLQISLDHNDRYRLIYYRGETLLGHADVAPDRRVASGLQRVWLDAPIGFDALGVLPLYGDGGYSLGHVLAD
jgi:hypothetical protein